MIQLVNTKYFNMNPYDNKYYYFMDFFKFKLNKDILLIIFLLNIIIHNLLNNESNLILLD